MSVAAASLAYEQFLELTEGFYRLSGCPLDYFESDAGKAIAFEVNVADVMFSVGYDPSAGVAQLFAHCLLGALPSEVLEGALTQLLQANLTEARLYNGTYCIDAATQQVAYYWRSSVAGIDAAMLCEQLARIATLATHWRTDPLGHKAATGEQATTGQLAMPLRSLA